MNFSIKDLSPVARLSSKVLSLADVVFQDFRWRWHILNAKKIDQTFEGSLSWRTRGVLY
jgi:hypothetical protein